MATEMRIELIQVPVSDIDRAKAFYVDQVGFNADHDHQVSDELRFVQLTPPGSACSIALTSGAHEMAPGSVEGLRWSSPTPRPPQGARRARRRGQRRPGVPVGELRLLQGSRRQRLGASGDDAPLSRATCRGASAREPAERLGEASARDLPGAPQLDVAGRLAAPRGSKRRVRSAPDDGLLTPVTPSG